MGFQALFKFVKCWRAPDVVSVLTWAYLWYLLLETGRSNSVN